MRNVALVLVAACAMSANAQVRTREVGSLKFGSDTSMGGALVVISIKATNTGRVELFVRQPKDESVKVSVSIDTTQAGGIADSLSAIAGSSATRVSGEQLSYSFSEGPVTVIRVVDDRGDKMGASFSESGNTVLAVGADKSQADSLVALLRRARAVVRDYAAMQPRAARAAITKDDALFDFQVEKPASLAKGQQQPPYPPALRAANIEGQVVAKFVVDTSGRADMETFEVIKSDHELFSASVRSHLPSMQFVPAEVGGRKVRQLVQYPFQFSLVR